MDPYRELGVERGAPPDELRRAYRERVRRLHPDSRPQRHDPGADEELRRVTAAWEVISAADPAADSSELADDEDAVRPHPAVRRRVGIVLTLLVLFLLFVFSAYAGSPADEQPTAPGGRRATTLRGGD